MEQINGTNPIPRKPIDHFHEFSRISVNKSVKVIFNGVKYHQEVEKIKISLKNTK